MQSLRIDSLCATNKLRRRICSPQFSKSIPLLFRDKTRRKDLNRDIKADKKCLVVNHMILDIGHFGAAAVGFLLGNALARPYAEPVKKAVARQLRPISCKECRGIGHNTCPDCQGRGKRGGVMTGSPLRSCYTCQTKGRVVCLECKATGIENNWLFKPAENGGWGPRGEM